MQIKQQKSATEKILPPPSDGPSSSSASLTLQADIAPPERTRSTVSPSSALAQVLDTKSCASLTPAPPTESHALMGEPSISITLLTELLTLLKKISENSVELALRQLKQLINVFSQNLPSTGKKHPVFASVTPAPPTESHASMIAPSTSPTLLIDLLTVLKQISENPAELALGQLKQLINTVSQNLPSTGKKPPVSESLLVPFTQPTTNFSPDAHISKEMASQERITPVSASEAQQRLADSKTPLDVTSTDQHASATAGSLFFSTTKGFASPLESTTSSSSSSYYPPLLTPRPPTPVDPLSPTIPILPSASQLSASSSLVSKVSSQRKITKHEKLIRLQKIPGLNHEDHDRLLSHSRATGETVMSIGEHFQQFTKILKLSKEDIFRIALAGSKGYERLNMLATAVNQGYLNDIPPDQIREIVDILANTHNQQARRKQAFFDLLITHNPDARLTIDHWRSQSTIQFTDEDQLLLANLKKLTELSQEDLQWIFQDKHRRNFKSTIEAFCQYYELLRTRRFTKRNILDITFHNKSKGVVHLGILAKTDPSQLAKVSLPAVVKIFINRKIDDKEKALNDLFASATQSVTTLLVPAPSRAAKKVRKVEEDAHDLLADGQTHPSDVTFTDLLPFTRIPSVGVLDDPSSLSCLAPPTPMDVAQRAKPPRAASSAIEKATDTPTEYLVKRSKMTRQDQITMLQKIPGLNHEDHHRLLSHSYTSAETVMSIGEHFQQFTKILKLTKDDICRIALAGRKGHERLDMLATAVNLGYLNDVPPDQIHEIVDILANAHNQQEHRKQAFFDLLITHNPGARLTIDHWRSQSTIQFTDEDQPLLANLKKLAELSQKDLQWIFQYKNRQNFKSYVEAFCQYYKLLRRQFSKRDILDITFLNKTQGVVHLGILAKTDPSQLAKVSLPAVVNIFRSRKIGDKEKALNDLFASAMQPATLSIPGRFPVAEKVLEAKTTNTIGDDAFGLLNPLTPRQVDLGIFGQISEDEDEDENEQDLADQQDHLSPFNSTFTDLAPLTPTPSSHALNGPSSLSFFLPPDMLPSLAGKPPATETDTITGERPKTNASPAFFSTQNRLMPPPAPIDLAQRAKQPRTPSSAMEMATGTPTEYQVKRSRIQTTPTSVPVDEPLLQPSMDGTTPSPR